MPKSPVERCGRFAAAGTDGWVVDGAGANGSGWARAWRPPGLVERTRWGFGLTALLALVLTLPGSVIGSNPAQRLVVLLAAGALVTLWAHRYRRRRAPLALDLLEAVLVLAIAASGPEPATVATFVLTSLWFRAVYGTTARVVLAGVFLAAAAVLSVLLWGLWPGREGLTASTGILRTLPGLFLVVGTARYLGRSLFAREQAQHRDAALVGLGNQLIGLTDRSAIRGRARECLVALCAATPGLRAVVVEDGPGGLTVLDRAGDLGDLPSSLPRSVVPSGPEVDDARPLPGHPALTAAAGSGTTWLRLPLAEGDGWILVGAPRRVPAEAVVALQSMTNQIALALRTSDAHHDLTTRADHDVLTGLADRAAFTAALDLALADPERRLALLFLGLDDFKTVNDGLGYAAGDDLLRHVAARLRWAVRPDDLCARLGGDEFAVLLSDADDSAATVARRLVELIATPVSLKGRLAQVGASVGLAFAARGTSAAELVQHADIAMYAAKAKGRNRVQAFDPSLLREDGQAAFEAELGAAADAGQLVVHYQPIVSVADGRCTSVEALVRWQHPQRGLLAPAEFITTAERTGAIVGIGAFVLRRACADATGWSGRTGRLAVHVNISAVQLTDEGFPESVRTCIAEFGMAPKQLVLEITESMVLDSPAILVALDRLVALGAGIAIDDFGTGYSALSTIRTLPLDIVKLDKSFISGGPSHPADEAVVGAIVQMAGRLGLRIVAEGVERVDQQQFLADVGADAAQGYLYLRPAPAAQFAAWLDRRYADVRTGGSVTPIGPRRAG